ncbi:MAG: hypothetical protein IPJ65_25420 [Archangiaceae bacterium]|nr:hypothetical protein [Archangiaceae bacterium]
MLRNALAAAVVLVSSTPTWADDEDEVTRTEPAANFSAEAQVQTIRLQPDSGDGVAWSEVTLKVTRCIAGPCTVAQYVKVMVTMEGWRGRHGDVMGVVRYAWKDKGGGARTWALALRLEDTDQKERFDRECEVAVANAEQGAGDSVLATR